MLLRVLAVACVLLLTRVLFAILGQYPDYFPANFESAFLAGRRHYFFGLYGFAFYGHILAGPPAVLISGLLVFTPTVSIPWQVHRILGKVLLGLTLLVLLPSGLVMATRASTGWIAGAGFATHAVVTGVAVLLAVRAAMGGQIERHRGWAMRTFLLLCAPMLLRINSGFLSIFDLESVVTYQASAWLAWIVPLLAYQVYLHQIDGGIFSESNPRCP